MLNFISDIKQFARNVIIKNKKPIIKNIAKDVDMGGIKKELGFVYICSDGKKFACKQDATIHEIHISRK